MKTDFYSYNPFRILGLSVSTSKREIVRRAEEILTFLAVGQTPHYDTDLHHIGSFRRDEETVRNAMQTLENNDETLLYQISWFWILDNYDDLAIAALKNKDFTKVIRIWLAASQQDSKAFVKAMKNIATTEHILALQESQLDYEHLVNFYNYLSTIISSSQLTIFIRNFISKLTSINNDISFLSLLGTYTSCSTMPIIERWADQGNLDKLGNFFEFLDKLAMPLPIRRQIKSDYINILKKEVDRTCDKYKEISDDYERIAVEIGTFYEKMLFYFKQIVIIGDRSETEYCGDKIGKIIIDRAIIYGNKTDRWQKSRDLLELARHFISGSLIKDRFQRNLDIISNIIEQEKRTKDIFQKDGDAVCNIKEEKKLRNNKEKKGRRDPFIDQYYGLGTALYGHANYDSRTNSYEATRYFTILGIPIIPLSRYRVTRTTSYYKFIEKIHLRSIDRWHLTMVLLITIMISFYYIYTSQNSQNSSNYHSQTYNQPSSAKTLNSKLISSPSPSNPLAQYITPPETITYSQEISKLKLKITNNKSRISRLESELKDLEIIINNYDTQLKEKEVNINDTETKIKLGLFYDESAYENSITDYNNLVSKRNGVFAEFNLKYKEYEDIFNATKLDIARYNTLIIKN